MDNNKYVLILTVGGSPEPLIFSINEANPDIVCFLHSEGSKKDAQFVAESVDDNIEFRYFLVSSHESIDATFEKASEVFDEFKDKNYFVHVDGTGGTKVMSNGLVLAAARYNKIVDKYTYVGSTSKDGRNKNGVGVVKEGSELIKKQIFNFED